MFFPPSAVPTAYGQGTKFREPTGTVHHIGNSVGALELDTSSSRHGADWTAPAGDFVLCTTSLRGWTAADAEHLHHTIFIKTANSVCRGAGDSHLPRSMRARSPHGLFPVASDQFQPCIFHHFRVFSGSPAGSDQIAACHEGIRAGVEDP